MPNPLPEFEQPPLDEMVMGVQFDPLPKFRAAHLGLYWSRIRSQYPHTEDQPPLPSFTEQMEIKPSAVSVSATLVGAVLPRCWFLTESRTELIQLQQDRFLRNWRQLDRTERYPRFGPLAREFRRSWEGFLTFLGEEGLGPARVNQCELTYINNIETDAVREQLGELAGVFTLLRPRGSQQLLPPPEMVSWQVRHKLPEGRGRLYIEMNPAFRARDLKLVLRLALVARGAPAGGMPDEVAAWFDMAHDWTVRAFADLTEPGMHELWRKRP
ncbi:MAG TPA: TIGR04255 family protein [Gemmataceae bacterium]|nr:TIGR04255 family protein [Gemmataceae bacterium]